MIDLLTLTKNGLTDNEVRQIVEFNGLQTNSKGGKIYYDNMNQKNLKDGFYLRIETNNKMKLAVSLHKYRNMLDSKGFVNYDLFTMAEATKTAHQLAVNTGIQLNQMNVYGYEIGMNLYLSEDCRAYLDLIESIGLLENKRAFFVNPKYKNERLKTTYFYRDMRKVYKVYDKNFEMVEKRRKEDTGHPNILRIETVFHRVEKMPMEKFLSQTNIKRMTNQFISDWRTIKFKSLPVVPKGTSGAKQELCAEILKHGAEKVLSDARESLKNNQITPKQFRRIREFVQNDWDKFKSKIRIVQSDTEREFREVLKNTFTLLTHTLSSN